jgi:histone H3/H4
LSFKDRDEITELAKHAYSRAKASGSSVFARSIESPFASMIGRAVEYVITEFLELAGTVANNDDRNTITLNDLKKVAKSDKELELVFKMTK